MARQFAAQVQKYATQARKYAGILEPIPMKKHTFSVYEVDSGYVAELPGGVVIAHESFADCVALAQAKTVELRAAEPTKPLTAGTSDYGTQTHQTATDLIFKPPEFALMPEIPALPRLDLPDETSMKEFLSAFKHVFPKAPR